MNLETSYNFAIEDHHFYINVDWECNLLYLENFIKYKVMYIDSALTFFTVQGISFSLAAEQNYGDLLDIFASILAPHGDENTIFESSVAKLIKHDNNLILSFTGEHFECLSFECNAELVKIIEELRDEIVHDFKKMANNLTELKVLLNT